MDLNVDHSRAVEGDQLGKGLLTMSMSRLSSAILKSFGVVLFCALATAGWSQPNYFEGGEVLRESERTEAIENVETIAETYNGYGYGATYNYEEGGDLPWIPFLSPSMIWLDCWITKSLNIKHFYEQQAALQYFARSETCADLALSHDPYVGSAWKYSLFAPIYALSPNMLPRTCGCGGPVYGMAAPIPSVGVVGPNGPQLMQPIGAPPSAPPEYAPMMEPAPGAPPETWSAPSTQTPVGVNGKPFVASSGSQWAQMSDEQILTHFGLNQTAPASQSPLDSPAIAAGDFEYADQAPSMSASTIIAQNELPPPIISEVNTTPVIREVSEVRVSPSKRVVKEQPAPEGKEFSMTDKEYGKMLDIEKALLGDSAFTE